MTGLRLTREIPDETEKIPGIPPTKNETDGSERKSGNRKESGSRDITLYRDRGNIPVRNRDDTPPGDRETMPMRKITG